MRGFLILFGIVVGIGLAIGWFFTFGPSRAPAVEVTHLARGAAVEAVYATGTVEPSVMMPIAPRIAGRLVELAADEGQDVTKDQVLAKFEDTDIQKTLEELHAREDFAIKDFERKSALGKKGYAKKSEAEQAHSELDAIRAGIARTEAEASYMKLIAPADGRIIRRDGEIGQMIPLNQPVFWMSCCAPLRISAEVDEEDISRVSAGQKVLIRADAFPGKTFDGEVQAITPKGDPVSRSYRVRISVAGDLPFRIGMTAESNIIISEKQDTPLLENSALEKDHVWVVTGGKLEKKAVTTGLRGVDKTEITSGLTEEDAVVLLPEKDFTEGKAVRISGKK